MDPEKLKQFLPTYYRYKPIANTKKPMASDDIYTDENPHPDQQGNSFTDEPFNLTYMVLGFFILPFV